MWSTIIEKIALSFGVEYDDSVDPNVFENILFWDSEKKPLFELMNGIFFEDRPWEENLLEIYAFSIKASRKNLMS